jgi:hypothetical protein
MLYWGAGGMIEDWLTAARAAQPVITTPGTSADGDLEVIMTGF